MFFFFQTGGDSNAGQYIYYSNLTHISYVSVDGLYSDTILEAGEAYLGFDETSNLLWFYDQFTLSLYTCNPDGSNKTLVLFGENMGPFVVNTLDQSVYYIDTVDKNRVKAVYFNGTNLQDDSKLLSTEFEDLAIGLDPMNR